MHELRSTSLTKDRIRSHYDLSTPFYWLLWGRHIHHGLWTDHESASEAQERLVERLTALAEIGPGLKVLDVGCGMGGSSIHLARRHGCEVTGITLSPLQRRWAAGAALLGGAARRTRFQCVDAEQVEFAAESFDRVWSVECTEHLFDKPAFFRRAASWLRPGGRMAVCAWLAAGDEARNAAEQLEDVCRGFLCPSLGSMDDYRQWMERAGLTVRHTEDWTAQVARTWEICLRRVERSGVRWLARLVDHDSVSFLDNFRTILEAYRTGAMQYGSLVAEKEPCGDACD